MITTGHKWKFKGSDEAEYPTVESIVNALRAMIDRLSSEPVGTTIEMGGVIIIKSNTGYETYFLLGEIDN